MTYPERLRLFQLVEVLEFASVNYPEHGNLCRAEYARIIKELREKAAVPKAA